MDQSADTSKRICLAAALLALSCANGPNDPNRLWQQINVIRHSDPERARALAKEGSECKSPLWRWRFEVRQAELDLDENQKLDSKTVARLQASPPEVPKQEADARLASLQGLIQYATSQRFDIAEDFFKQALASGGILSNDPCWKADLLVHQKARAQLFIMKEFNLVPATLEFAGESINACPDRYYQGQALLEKGFYLNKLSRYEEAIRSFQQSLAVAKAGNFRSLRVASSDDLELAYSFLGDSPDALNSFDQLDAWYKSRSDHPSKVEQTDWGHAIGHQARANFFLLKHYDQAQIGYERAIQVAQQVADNTFLPRWRVELAMLLIAKGDLPAATRLNQLLVDVKDPDPNEVAYKIAHLNQAHLLRLQGKNAEAETELASLLKTAKDDRLTWQSHTELAHVYAASGRSQPAVLQFEAALDTANQARLSIQKEGYRIKYFSQLTDLYRDYTEFLVEDGQTEKALRVSDQGHARLLTEKLNRTETITQLDFKALARAKNATILAYSIGAVQSYLWIITPDQIHPVVKLPNAKARDLANLIAAHTESIQNHDSLERTGRNLYDLLIGPASYCIPAGHPIIIVPDGPLASLNFETLIPPGAPHYWVEDFVISSAPSVSLLLPTSPKALRPTNNILLVGNTPPAEGLPSLNHADLADIQALFPRQAFSLPVGRASPDAVLSEIKKGYSWVHFSAHAKAFPDSPLDSYLMVAKGADGNYQLYARDLETVPPIDLVTLKACTTAGEGVDGEGLVGLSWAFLSAGAKNVVATLWPVEDSSSAVLMKHFYTHLRQAQPPALALHNAKIDMIKDHADPFAWAGFQIFSR